MFLLLQLDTISSPLNGTRPGRRVKRVQKGRREKTRQDRLPVRVKWAPFVPRHNDHRISLISMSPLSFSPATEEEEEEEKEERVKGIDHYTRLVKVNA